MRIGLISDTHNFFDPRLPNLLNGVDHILHAGDVGLPRIVHQLEEIAPVTAVLGNTDDPAFGYRLTEVIELGGLRFLVHHIVQPERLDPELEARIGRERPALVVFGHTHKPFSRRIGGIHFINPGYAGANRFNLARSVAILHLQKEAARLEPVDL